MQPPTHTSTTSTRTTLTSITTTTTTTATVTTTTAAVPSPELHAPNRVDCIASALPPAPHHHCWSPLPDDIKFRLFTLLVEAGDLRPLRSLAHAARSLRADVRNFYFSTELGKLQASREVQRSTWRATNSKMLESAQMWREVFARSDAIFTKGDEKEGEECRKNCPGIFVRVTAHSDPQLTLKRLAAVCQRPVKIVAARIGSHGFLKVVLPLMEGISSTCPLIVNVPDGLLTREDLPRLVEVVRKNQNLISLDLSENSLCDGDELSEALVDLVSVESPLCQLYLASSGLTWPTALAIRDAMQKHPCLLHVDMRRNELEIDRIPALPGLKIADRKPDEPDDPPHL